MSVISCKNICTNTGRVLERLVLTMVPIIQFKVELLLSMVPFYPPATPLCGKHLQVSSLTPPTAIMSCVPKDCKYTSLLMSYLSISTYSHFFIFLLHLYMDVQSPYSQTATIFFPCIFFHFEWPAAAHPFRLGCHSCCQDIKLCFHCTFTFICQHWLPKIISLHHCISYVTSTSRILSPSVDFLP